ncbi:MAG: TIGR02757 family protein [bacterium]|nr:TIGR02757 family protein [bacterium]
MITKTELDKLAKYYETKEFIKDDPIQFPYRGNCKKEIELYGFISSMFAYGNRKIFISKLNEIFSKAENDIVGYIKNGDFGNLKNIEYRFSKDNDIIMIFKILSKLYNTSNGLEELFMYGYNNNLTVEHGIKCLVDYFYANCNNQVGHGFYHMIPNPAKGGAMKRMNMFLRWMVRSSEVDLGIWNSVDKSKLLIPLDVHVSRVSRAMGLLKRKNNDYKAVIELMQPLREFCPEDPVKYDFAMFAFGVQSNKKGNTENG